ncbi:MAG TPA: hypothetical protein PK335_03370 [Draconibacterium sp.]|nr:hypothetical protein [Draconibacterium sp.]
MLDKDKKSISDDFVLQALKQEPDFSLPDNFADVLAEKAGRQFAWKQYIREFLIYLAVLAGISVVVAGMSLIWFKNDWKIWFDFIVSNAWIVAGINVLLLFTLFTDRVLLRYFLYRSDTTKESS